MPWFQKACRQLGLALHHVAKPVRDDSAQTTVVSKQVEEKKIDQTTTLRRTVIEEIEIRSGESS